MHHNLFWISSDPEEENVVPNAKSSGQDTLVGRYSVHKTVTSEDVKP